MTRREKSTPAVHAPGAIEMQKQKPREERRQWIRPTLESQSTLTTVTQSTSLVPMSLLFLQTSAQCFDGFGNPVPC